MPEYILHLRQLVGGDELLQARSVSAVLREGAGRVLLARHQDGGCWVLPAGTIEPGETPADAAVREIVGGDGGWAPHLVRRQRIRGSGRGRDPAARRNGAGGVALRVGR